MPQIVYAIQFKGRSIPIQGSPSTAKATATGSSSVVSTFIRMDGVSGTVEETAGDTAVFESDITFLDESTFQESGTITFGKGGNRIRFNTVGRGFIRPTSDPVLKAGAVMWQIEGGEGQFEGATGIITSNFTFNDGGDLTDNQLGVIFTR